MTRAACRVPTSYNNAVGASARYARSGVHGAYGARARVRVGEVERCMAGERLCLAPRRQPPNVMRQTLAWQESE